MKLFAKLLGVTSLLFAAAGYRLWNVYSYSRPHWAYPEYGQVYSMSSLAWSVYLTRTEALELYGLIAMAILTLIGAIAVDLFSGRPERENRERHEGR